MWGPAPENRQKRLGTLQHWIEDDIAKTPATTAKGLIVKAKIIISIDNDPDGYITEFAKQLVSDLEHLAGV